ncbi:hypothetical protein [Actinoplanes sp. NPDC049265]|uniref:hypothetical protein n=1 Tax=Actinoplanes sp. NPDC049265 TaxID=3363902 RepID=UPI00371A7D44
MTTFYLLVVGDVDLAQVRAALSAAFSVPDAEVDVAEMLTDDDRNWDAAVLCTFQRLSGDVSMQLDIYVRDSVSTLPDIAQLAGSVAGSVGRPILYPASEHNPSAHYLADSYGPPTRARVYDGDAEGELLIDAVERPVPQLPGVRVDAQPEVIKWHRMVTPVTEGFRDWLAASMLATVDTRDPIWQAQNLLGGWESLTVRMARGWPPDGWYPQEYYYRDDLSGRDELAALPARLPEDVAAQLAVALERVDEAFRRLTRETEHGGPDGWWRRRVPDPEPWLAQPGT